MARLGITPSLAWGFLGVLLFMVGDGVESGYLAPFLAGRGVSTAHVSLVFTVYGFAAGIAGWLSGALSDAWGPRRVILIGFVVWIVFEVAFLTAGLHDPGVALLLLTYGLRGLGYPLFAFGFLVWITVATPPTRLASAMGWFWFAFTGGLPMLGSLVASWCVPRIGPVATLWVATAFAFAGGIIVLLGVQEPRGRRRLVPHDEKPLEALLSSITLVWRKPKTGLAFIVRIINTVPEFGFLLILPTFFVNVIGFSLVQWLRLLSVIFLSNIAWNLLFGLLGDRIGWRRTIALCGGVGCSLTTLALYYVPLIHHSFPATVIAGALYGATLAGYVPLSALMPSLVPEERGASLSLLNLGAGASVWIGPAMAGLLLPRIGVLGVMWVFSGLYLLSAVFAAMLRVPAPALSEAPPA